MVDDAPAERLEVADRAVPDRLDHVERGALQVPSRVESLAATVELLVGPPGDGRTIDGGRPPGGTGRTLSVGRVVGRPGHVLERAADVPERADRIAERVVVQAVEGVEGSPGEPDRAKRERRLHRGTIGAARLVVRRERLDDALAVRIRESVPRAAGRDHVVQSRFDRLPVGQRREHPDPVARMRGQRVAGGQRKQVVVDGPGVAGREDVHAGLAVGPAEDPGRAAAMQPRVDQGPDVGRLDRLDGALGAERLRERLARLGPDPPVVLQSHTFACRRVTLAFSSPGSGSGFRIRRVRASIGRRG